MSHFLDLERLEAIDPAEFRKRRPYPWANPEGLLTPTGYEQLRKTLPGLDIFDQNFGKERLAGQAPHDRYSLEYTDGVPVEPAWRQFIAELRGDRYRAAMGRLFGSRKVEFRFHWHYTPSGCSVSPHCDSKRELGSHLFYFNGEDEWDPTWGGETLVLDDGGRLDYRSAPDFDAFDAVLPCRSIGNHSAILSRTDHAWHGVREIRAPGEQMRKVFIVVVNPSSLYWRVRDALIGKQKQRY